MSALPPKRTLPGWPLSAKKRTSELAGVTFGAAAPAAWLLLAILGVSSRVSKSGPRIARPDPLIESFGFSFCFYEYREILAGL
jgi:hypothetical protein